MLFNNERKKEQTLIDCLTCTYWNKDTKRCAGIGKKCFEFDKKTGVAIDPYTKLPIKLN